MKQINSLEHLNQVLLLLDIQILKILLSKNEMDTDSLETLTDIRTIYKDELNNLIHSKNTSDMYDKKYWKSYRKNKW